MKRPTTRLIKMTSALRRWTRALASFLSLASADACCKGEPSWNATSLPEWIGRNKAKLSVCHQNGLPKQASSQGTREVRLQYICGFPYFDTHPALPRVMNPKSTFREYLRKLIMITVIHQIGLRWLEQSTFRELHLFESGRLGSPLTKD